MKPHIQCINPVTNCFIDFTLRRSLLGFMHFTIFYNAYIQVPPAELESLLLGHPSVADVAVIGLPDEEDGELPLAFVVLKDTVKVSEDEIKDFVQGSLMRGLL